MKAREKKQKNTGRRLGVLSWVLIGLGGAGFALALVMVVRIGLEYSAAQNEYTSLREGYVSKAAENPGEAGGEAQPSVVDLRALQALNSDCVAWLELPGVEIEYPVLRGGDNDYYLNHTFERAQNASGAIFMDFRSSADFTDGHSLIYGHNMLDGSMFSGLDRYQDNAFLAENPMLYIHLNDVLYTCTVVAAGRVPADDPLYGMLGGGAAQAGALAEAAAERLGALLAGFDPADYTKEDRFLTLSTCTATGDGVQRDIAVAVLGR
ncbi:class B sortase [Ruminococcaceae bacterium OttesenSCG-928-D13]|nr:class B sortase [Ruminococcaceae bacterium OttesenSCG-928-D13]